MKIEIFAGAINIILLAIFIGLLKKFFPHRSNSNIEEAKLEKYKSKFRWLELMSILPIFLIASLMILLSKYLLQFLNSKLHNFQRWDIYFTANRNCWYLCGMLFSFALFYVPLKFLYKIILKEKFEYFIEYSNRTHGIDGVKPLKFFSIVFFTLALISTFGFNNTFIRLNNSKIEVSEPWQLVYESIPVDEIGAIYFYNKKLNSKKNEVYNFKHFLVTDINGKIIVDTKNDMFQINNNELKNFAAKNQKKIIEKDIRYPKTP